jgi:hypothetical protein
VPVVLNGDAGSRPDMVAKFFKRVARHFANEHAVVTPNGELLAHDPAEGLKKWKALPADARKSLDDLGKYDDSLDPAPPRNGLVFDVYARGLKRDDKGKLQIYKTEVARSLEAGSDHLWLTEAEWQAMVPAKPARGDVVKAPEAVTERVCRYCLIDLVRVGGNGGPRKPEEVLSRELRLTVEEATPKKVRLRLDGPARLATHDGGSGARDKKPKVDDYRFLGEAVYDVTKQAFTRFDLVAFSETGHYDEVHDKVLPLGVALEVSRGERPADRLPPSSYSPAYFGKGKERR